MKKTRKLLFQNPKGMNDILPDDELYWEKARHTIKGIAEFYNFSRIDTPLLEDSGLFVRNLGETSDVVEKEMYSFKTKGGDALPLRPEGTASIMRAYLQHVFFSQTQPVRLYYIGAMFRHDNPQRWRYRQFHHAGFEIIGDADAVYDAQAIFVVQKALEELKVKDAIVQINTLGCRSCRHHYRERLKAYYRNKADKLCRDCKRRFAKNPLRLLDCKNEEDAAIKEKAPVIIDSLCVSCHNHFKNVLEILDFLRISYQLVPYLVRGFDYYSRTVFEVVPPRGSIDTLPTSQNALASGGRFDYLAELLGGRPTPAVGGAIGLDRLIEFIREKNLLKLSRTKPRLFIVQLGDLAKRKALLLMEDFRRIGLGALESFGKDSIKTQLRIADKEGTDLALIIGQKEAHEDNAIIRDMRSGSQETAPIEKVAAIVKR